MKQWQITTRIKQKCKQLKTRVAKKTKMDEHDEVQCDA